MISNGLVKPGFGKTGSIPPSVWGHSGWKFLFSVAYVYPEHNPDPQTRQNYYIYLTHLKHMLPCDKCRQHYAEYLENKPVQFYLTNRESLFFWLLGLHNKSNRDTTLLSAGQAITRYLPRIREIQNQEQEDDRLIRKLNRKPGKCTDCDEH